MPLRHRAASLGLALLLASIGPSQVAADEPDDIEGGQEIDQQNFAGGNAVDSGRVDRQARLLYYRTQPALLRYLMSTLEGRAVLYRYWLFRQLYWKPAAPKPAAPARAPMPQPGDLPSESVLDQIDERDAPPVLVGMPGSGTALSAFDSIEGGEPPPESILDQIADSPKPLINHVAPPTVQTKQ
jgi:hypothetical protein